MSNETKWTPGPWRTNKDFEVEGYPFAVFTVPNGGEFTSVAVCAEQADARLIAAAPGMAALLERNQNVIMDALTSGHSITPAIADNMHAVLADTRTLLAKVNHA